MIKQWSPVALLVSTCGREAAFAVQMLEARGHSMTVNQMRCFEGQVPPDIRTICKFMATRPMVEHSSRRWESD